MKLRKLTIFYTVSLLIFSGCGTLIPKPNNEVSIDPTLPIVTLTQNGVITDMNSVALEWSKINDRRVKGVYVYKQKVDPANPSSGGARDDYYDKVKSRFITHYVDNDITPGSQYNYSFKTFSENAESVMSDVVPVRSLPLLDSVSWIHSINSMPRSAKIIWRPHSNEKVKAYIIERKTLEDEKWEKLDTVYGRLSAEYIDTDLLDNHVYKYRIKVVTYDDIVSKPSEVVKVVTKPLPQTVLNIIATNNMPKQIGVSWDSTSIKDFLNYNVYRSDSVDSGYEVVAKTKESSYLDDVKEDGKYYFYRVSVVDKDGLESEHEKQSIQGMSLSKPEAPSLSEAVLVNDKIELKWSSNDTRIKSFIVMKKTQQGWFDVVKDEFVDIKGDKFTDSAIAPETTYYYKVVGVDEYAIRSKPSMEVKFTTTKTQGNVVNSLDYKEKAKENSKDDEKNVVVPVQDISINEN